MLKILSIWPWNQSGMPVPANFRREAWTVWIPKRQWQALENRVADLEKKVQDQSPEKLATELKELTDRFCVPSPRKEPVATK